MLLKMKPFLPFVRNPVVIRNYYNLLVMKNEMNFSLYSASIAISADIIIAKVVIHY